MTNEDEIHVSELLLKERYVSKKTGALQTDYTSVAYREQYVELQTHDEFSVILLKVVNSRYPSQNESSLALSARAVHQEPHCVCHTLPPDPHPCNVPRCVLPTALRFPCHRST